MNLPFFQVLAKNDSQAKVLADFIFRESKKIDYSKGIANAYGEYAAIFEKQGQYDSAIKNQFSALAIRLKAKDTHNICLSYVNMAKLYGRMGQLDQKMKYLTAAQGLMQNQRDTEMWIFIAEEKGILFASKEQLDSAKKYLWRGLDLAQRFSQKKPLGYALENYANVLNQAGFSDSAYPIYKQAIACFNKYGFSDYLARIYNNIAYYYWDKGQTDSTRYFLEKGLSLSEKNGNKQEIENNILNLIQFWEEQNQTHKSNHYLHSLLKLKDSTFSQNLESKIASIEKDFTVKLKNEENAKLKSEVSRKNLLRNASLVLAALLLLLALFQWRIYSQRKKLVEKDLQLKESEIDQLLQDSELKNLDALLEGRETERKRIGRDLHDRLGSILSTVKLHFSAIEERIDNLKTENKEQYDRASELLDEAVGEVRKIANDLVSGVLVKYGLSAALNDMKNTLEATGKINVNIFEAGKGVRNEPEFEIAVYRIIQELISNILKHANATKADIHVTNDAETFTLIVEDNGIGFDPKNPAKFGLGMSNIRQRVAALGGEVNFDSNPGAGATVIVEIPNKPESL